MAGNVAVLKVGITWEWPVECVTEEITSLFPLNSAPPKMPNCFYYAQMKPVLVVIAKIKQQWHIAKFTRTIWLSEVNHLWRTAKQTWAQLSLAEAVRILGRRIVDSHGDIIALDPEIFPLVSQHLQFSGDCSIRSKCLSGA